MRIIKPEWLRHDSDKKHLTSIFSVDFHPDGTRLATAGMDNKIRLWSTPAIAEQNPQENKDRRLLATLSAHSGAVMCVRFSHGAGRYLASGADDMVVLIWERDDSDAGTGNIGASEPSHESWRPVRRLTGHESDVCDVAWGPGNRFLATCGLDNTVHIWDGGTFARVATLRGHEQFVKGVTFDPAGKYLATQSDDKTLRVWRTSDWAQHAVVRQPFEDNLFSTYFRRPSWSPDGDCVAAANAANGKVPVAAVISRGSWTADLSFVGHRAAVEAVRFNPSVFRLPNSNEEADIACVCAAGGQDRGVSVWLTSQHMPIAAATNLFAGNLMDLAWHTVPIPPSSDDDSVVAYLAACSYDGTVALLEFTQAELGRPLAAADQEALLSKHGWIKRDANQNSSSSHPSSTANRRPVLAESAEQLRLEEQGRELAKKKSKAPAGGDRGERESRIAQIMEQVNNPSVTQEPTTSALPKPMRTTDGKKRVAPVLVRPLGKSSTAKEPGPQAAASSAPMDVEESRRMGHGDPSPPNPPAAKSTTTKPPPGTLVERVAVDAPIWIEARVLGTRLDAGPPAAETDSTDESTGGGGVRIAGSVGLAQELGRQTLVHAQSISAARVHLSVPRVAAHVTSDGRGAAHVTLSAFNTAGSARLVCTPNSAVAGDKGGWTKHVARRILLVAASGAVAAASCEDGTLHVFDGATGARLLPPIVCEAHLAALRCAQRFCVALDCVGQLSVWDCGDRPRVVVDRVSVAPLLYSAELPVISSSNGEYAPGEGVVAAPGRQAPAVALTAVDVAGDQGAPVVCLSDGRAFAYDLAVRVWLCIGDPLAYAGSDFAGSTSSSLAATTATAAVFTPTSRTPLGRIQETGSHQRRLTSTTNKTTATPAPSLPSDVRMLVTLDHIEHQVGAAAAIGSRDDVVRWTDILARHLARAGDAARTEFWLRSLLGPPLIHGLLPTTMPGQPTQWEEWVPALAGVPRRQLLGRMLPILAGNRRLQAVVTEYSAALARLAPEAT